MQEEQPLRVNHVQTKRNKKNLLNLNIEARSQYLPKVNLLSQTDLIKSYGSLKLIGQKHKYKHPQEHPYQKSNRSRQDLINRINNAQIKKSMYQAQLGEYDKKIKELIDSITEKQANLRSFTKKLKKIEEKLTYENSEEESLDLDIEKGEIQADIKILTQELKTLKIMLEIEEQTRNEAFQQYVHIRKYISQQQRKQNKRDFPIDNSQYQQN